MKTSKKYRLEDDFLALVSNACSLEDESKIVDLFYRCMKVVHDEAVKEGINKAHSID